MMKVSHILTWLYMLAALGLGLLAGVLAHPAHAGGGLTSPQAGAPLAHARVVYSSTNVTTSAYVQLLAATPNVPVNTLEIFDSSGQTLVIATGASGSEVDAFYVFPGGNGPTRVSIPPNTRLSIKAVTATASSGELDLNVYQ